MKLYYSPGACSLAVHIALRETDRRFDRTMLRWCERFGIDLALYGPLDNLRDRVGNRPSVIASLDAERLTKHAFLRSAS